MPASCCGIVGLKPTYGLVPYTGAMSLERTVDALGPMAKNVTDCALLLEVSMKILSAILEVIMKPTEGNISSPLWAL